LLSLHVRKVLGGGLAYRLARRASDWKSISRC
jgi:hypothetical protein